MDRQARKPSRDSRFRRLREAIAEHNWFSVAIEVLIVTIGVLLAFEIEQWGQRRERAAEERQFLERLYREYQRGIDELTAVIGTHDRVMRNFQKAFAARRDRALLDQYASTVGFGCDAGYLRTTPFNNTAFEELVSSGRLAIVSDPNLRARIRDLTTEQASLKDRAALGTEHARDQNAKLDPYYRFELMPDGSTRCFADWPRLLDNPAAVTAAVRVYRMHELVRKGRVDLLQMTQEVRAEVGCELGKSTCRR